MKIEVTLFLSKQKPVPMTAGNGGFALRLRAFDRSVPSQTELWLLIWSGDSALHFWHQYGAELVPGTELLVQAIRVRVLHGEGRSASAELVATVTGLILPATVRKCAQFTYPKTPCNAHAVGVCSY
jgi:hypothetical protein